MFYNETTLSGVLTDIVKAARTGDYSNISTLLNKVILSIQSEFIKIPKNSTYLSKISYSLETVAAMLQMQNWVALADVLEYEFIPLWNSMHQ